MIYFRELRARVTSEPSIQVYMDTDHTLEVYFKERAKGQITVVKETDLDSSQMFSYTGDLGEFILSDSGYYSNSMTFTDLTLGQYEVVELAEAGWILTNIEVTDPDGETTVEIENRKATVDLDPNEHVTVIFTNTEETPPPTELVVDDPGAAYVGSWGSSSSQAGYISTGYRYNSPGSGSDTTTWTIDIPQAGTYEVYARWPEAGSLRAGDAAYTINHIGGPTTVDRDQRVNAGEWVYIGTYSFGVGSTSVVLSDDADGYVIADAIRFVYNED